MPDERKLVTIFFADVTGSTALGDTLDPEDVRTLMGRYYTHARQVIPSFGGRLEKFIGDAVMAVFGLPQANGDDAERALAAAIALRDTIAQDPVLGQAFSLRIGVNTGEVVATSNPSDNDFLVTGDAINVAARLQQQAQPEEILVGERTANAAHTAFLFYEPRSLEIRGKRQAQRVFPLKKARQMRQVERPPFVGRKQDLLQLSVLQARMLEEKRPQMVSIIAPSGTGKSRLLYEFLQRIDPEDGIQVATARCLPYGQTLAYWPLRGLLSELLGENLEKEQLVQAFLQAGHENRDAWCLSSYVLAALGLEILEKDAVLNRDYVFAGWRLLIESLARRQPRIIIFEDLHWASDSLLDLIEHITHVRIQAPLLLISLSRPDLLDRRPTWGGGRQNFTSLSLQPLTGEQTRSLVERLRQDLDRPVREQIVERSGGNPFFALELLRGLPEDGSAQTSSSEALPDTVHAAILARLDRLGSRERGILQVAATSSQPFHPTMLRRLLEVYTPQEIDDAFDELLARDFILPVEAGNFVFRHVLIRDVAYGTLSRTERIRLHSRIAECLEKSPEYQQDECVELIAFHYREAVLLARQSAVTLNPPIEINRALHFLLLAGEQASRAGAFEEANTHIQNAIDIAPESECMHLYEHLGDSVGWGDVSAQAYERALQMWRRSDAQNPLKGASLIRKLLICYVRGFLPGHIEKEQVPILLAEAARLAEIADNKDEQMRISLANVFARCRTKDTITDAEVQQGKQIALEAAIYFEQQGNWIAYSEALDAFASISMFKGTSYRDALEASQKRLTVPELTALEHGDAINMIVKAYILLGEAEAAIATLREALAQVRPGQPLVHLSSALVHISFTAYHQGKWEILEELKPSIDELWKQVQHDQGIMLSAAKPYIEILLLAIAREDQAMIDEAKAILKSAHPNPASKKRMLLRMLLVENQLPPATTPREITNDADLYGLVSSLELDLPIQQERIDQISADWGAHGLANISCMIAKAVAQQDYEALAQAIEKAEERHFIVHATRMRIVLARRTGDRSQLERARPILERLNDRKFLRRLKEVEAALTENVHSTF